MGKELYSVNAGWSKRKGGMIGSVHVAVGGGVKEYVCLRVAERQRQLNYINVLALNSQYSYTKK